MRNLSVAVLLSLSLIVSGCADETPVPSGASMSESPSQAHGLVEDGVAIATTIDEAVALSMELGNYRPSAAAAAFVPPPTEQLATKRFALVSQVGEIAVMQGSPTTVSDLGNGSFGLVLNNQIQNPMEIAKELLQTYNDEFDIVTVFTTFPDGGSENSVAWYLGIRNSVKGIGAKQTDTGAWWGSASNGKLKGFINMQYIGKYGSGLSNTSHPIHPVMGQEFAHQWAAFTSYVDQSGQISGAMLGRDDSHWASTLQANGSVMDGNEWVDQGSGKFWLKASNFRFSELDQYIMGLRGPEEVPDWFLINNASYNGKGINPAWPLPSGITVTGTREDISINQVIQAHGPRVPDHIQSPKDFRLAVVLVTRPDESAETVGNFVDRLENFRTAFEQAANQMSDGRMRVCTQLTAPCDSAAVAIQSVTVTEKEGNGDGKVDPGELVAIDFEVKNTGFGDAPDVTMDIETVAPDGLNIITNEVSLGTIPEGESKAADSPLLIKIPPTVGCGVEAYVGLKLTTDGRFFPGEIRFDIGVDTLILDGLEKPDEWTLDPYGTDTAEGGAWEIAEPEGVDALYTGVNLVTQLSQDHTPDGVNALVTGPGAGQIGEHDVDDGVTTALSPVYDLTDARDPILTWFTWHFAYDFNTPEGIVAVTNDILYTEATTDGGKTWTIIDADDSNEQNWRRKQVRLADVVELSTTLQLRFTMSDDDAPSLAEAMVDDIRIWDESLVCSPVVPDPDPDPDPGTDSVDPVDGTDAVDGSDGTSDSDPPTNDDPTTIDASGEETSGCQVSGQPNFGAMLLLGQLLLLLMVARRRQRR